MNMGGKMNMEGGGKMYNMDYSKDSSSSGKGGLQKKKHIMMYYMDKGTGGRLLGAFQEMLFGAVNEEDEWDQAEWDEDEEEWDDEEDSQEISAYYPYRELMTSSQYKNLGIDGFGGKMYVPRAMYSFKISF